MANLVAIYDKVREKDKSPEEIARVKNEEADKAVFQAQLKNQREAWLEHEVTKRFLGELWKFYRDNSDMAVTLTGRSASQSDVNNLLLENKTIRKVIKYASTGVYGE
jgi:hypothetical protein